jgi:hypothetical protein
MKDSRNFRYAQKMYLAQIWCKKYQNYRPQQLNHTPTCQKNGQLLTTITEHTYLPKLLTTTKKMTEHSTTATHH